ncbi:RsfA family transcriptional regulator [Caldibacillus sp. 210928-DFI.2.22]|uniref:RsfA family transcriptional regulator n=1 Tax=Bacillaceae TaxID=186817 RepID=UPI000D55E962|nr:MULTISPECIES: RsfA family transcriptional regulator [Caldibacillus]AWI12057.1 RsfA family transcriptional regulator [Caldibacillus thermoamylovorans]MCB7068556.1 RsfA family transcriptional regulator [Caldibacillus sp. 210928-DFI.2.22]MCB7072043.1 RsfA family transcriptional regulator [Caldibacillus sp. 210928-DFI.2.18]MDL0418568.1 RsfA family transcriptional regulator [Caldibacillus thermoamylovorans]
MTTVRQDAWTKDEDLLLAEVVLRHIREGSTQLKAFEEVGKKLSRTAAACGFRWNSSVRKQYKTGIELAKRQRKELKKKSQDVFDSHQVDGEKKIKGNEAELNGILSIEQVISFLQRLKEKEIQFDTSVDELKKYKEERDDLRKKLKATQEENEKMKKEINLLKDDYLALLSIMEKARKLALKEENQEEKMKFQMDINGNIDMIKDK